MSLPAPVTLAVALKAEWHIDKCALMQLNLVQNNIDAYYSRFEDLLPHIYVGGKNFENLAFTVNNSVALEYTIGKKRKDQQLAIKLGDLRGLREVSIILYAKDPSVPLPEIYQGTEANMLDLYLDAVFLYISVPDEPHKICYHAKRQEFPIITSEGK